MTPEVSLVIVSYKCKDQVIACIESVREHTHDASTEIIVVDNDSGDDTVRVLAERYPGIVLVPLEENIGFGRGCNEGANKAQGRYLLFLNPDATILPGAVDNLVAFAKRTPEALIWGGVTVNDSADMKIASCWRFPTLWSTFCISAGLPGLFPDSAIFNYEGYGGWDRRDEREVEIVSGCFFLIDMSLWRLLKGFDPDYFLYNEEADLCLRAIQNGAHPRICPEARVIHAGGGTSSLKSDRLVMLFKGKITFMTKHWPEWRLALGKLFLCAWPFSRLVAFSLANLVLRTPRIADKGRVWWEVWHRRKDWIGGYPAHE